MGALGVERLQNAFRAVLGGQFEVEIRAIVDHETWYSPNLSIEEVFTLWVAANLERSADSPWVLHPLRVSERKFLCQNLGIEAHRIVGKTQEELANLVLVASGLPILQVIGKRATLVAWRRLLEFLENEEPERAAVLARQQAERLLRKILYFYCSTRFATQFVAMLENPGTLRIPNKLQEEVAVVDSGRDRRITNLLVVDGWADLGFLALGLRKFSERLSQTAARHVSGTDLKLFAPQEYDSFSKLSMALQPYTHDRPSKSQSMLQDLRDALLEVISAVSDMITRGVLPDEVMVLEAGSTAVGEIFRCLDDSKNSRYYRAHNVPAVGNNILIVPSADCDYAFCEWVASPW